MTERFSCSILLFVLLQLSCTCSKSATALDTITQSKSIKDTEVIISSNGAFRMGFFSPINSTDRYVGIWRSVGSPETSVIWVANREKPLKDNSGVVMMSEDGNLVVLNGQTQILWSSDAKNPTTNASVWLLDSGNLVLQVNRSDGVSLLWESFQQPSNAFLPTMKLETNVRIGEKVQLISWKSSSDPSNGSFTMGLGTLSIPQLFIWNNSRPYWRSGPWNGQGFLGLRKKPDYSYFIDGVTATRDQDGNFYFTYAVKKLDISYFLLQPQGKLVRRYWDEEKKDWDDSWTPQETECDVYGSCGEFGVCNSDNPSICNCLRGFEPKDIEEWNRGNWTNGCVRVKPLRCERINSGNKSAKQDGFLKLKNIKLPDFAEWSPYIENECKDGCLNNCSCIAYAYDAGIGCMTWTRSLLDISKFTDGGIEFFIRLEHSELDVERSINRIIIITVVTGIFVIVIATFLLWRRKAKQKDGAMKEKSRQKLTLIRGGKLPSNSTVEDSISEDKLQQLPLFKIKELANATDNFNLSNKLGQGGFGPVYKGKLKDGQKIAVKRLSRASGQGFEEFMNEVLVISKLQHRNLVSLLGCCVEGEEKMLVYDFMPNKSLDAFIFDSTKQELLDWKKRFNIIEGISRGLLYLHRDSRLRIIHRDLKASNILLDEEMNPKISDFGMARIFTYNENQANTTRVVGTYGYMSPEYAMKGHFSEKSDIFSYGVLLLEIISGRRNTSFSDNEHSSSLIRHAWKLWNEENILALPDKVISDPCHRQEISRCIHVGLLCVEESAKDRPNISAVISMLNSETVGLPTPKLPAFTERRVALDIESSKSNERYSKNDVTITHVEGR